ncbi:hypothetical protein [Maribacter aestuarii]|uniref:hypothetical protein n=1 Tax=Maribacter aestuarii TaxID=1130723 RepID=UPI00248C6DBE|nr:hypothetical protein [Maribacter aestuarii]
MAPRKITLFLILLISFNSSGQQTTSKNNANDIFGMVHLFGKKKYNTFSGTWKFNNASTWLLLKDGWALKNPTLPPEEINFEKSRKENPSFWIKWKDDARFEKATIYKPSDKYERYELAVKLYSVNGTTISSSVTTSKLILSKDGRFETTSFSLAEVNSGNSTTRTGVRKDRKGTTSTAGNTTELGSGTVKSVKNSSKNAIGDSSGTYYINGHSITLKFDNGEILHAVFATDGKDSLILGTNFYFNSSKN